MKEKKVIGKVRKEKGRKIKQVREYSGKKKRKGGHKRNGGRKTRQQ